MKLFCCWCREPFEGFFGNEKECSYCDGKSESCAGLTFGRDTETESDESDESDDTDTES